MKHYIQGDVLLKPIKNIPEKAQKKQTKTVALGEVTGHHHTFYGNTDVFELEGRLYAQVYAPTPLRHQEHKEIIVDPGMYEIGDEREYDYFDEDMKKVID